jgi:hypothetical protein
MIVSVTKGGLAKLFELVDAGCVVPYLNNALVSGDRQERQRSKNHHRNQDFHQ